MANIPRLKDIYDDLIFDIEAEFNITIPTFGKSFLRGLAAVMAGVIYLIYLGQAKLQKNVFVDTADPESSGGTLERFGRVKLGRNPFPPVAGVYEAEVTGAIGATIVGGTTWKSNDDSSSPGFLFVIDSDFVFAATTETITLRALTGGLSSKLQVGDALTATIPIANVNAGATITATTTDPVDAETTEEYRDKTTQAFRSEPQGTASVDLRLWSLDVQGVRTSYPYARSGESATADLFVEALAGDGTASPSMITDVEAVIELDPDTTKPIYKRGRRSIGVWNVYVQSITPLDVVIEINGFVGLTTEIEDLIEEAISEYLSTVRPFVAAADVVEDRNDTVSVNNIIQVILSARPGSVFGTVTMEVDGNPLSSYQFTEGDIPKLDSVSWVP